MNVSRTIPLAGQETASLAATRGDVVEFDARGKLITGTVTSACVPANGKPQLSISTVAGARYTRRAASVRVIRQAAQAQPAAPVTFGQQAGQASPNSGKPYGAEPLTPAELAAVIGQCSRKSPTGIRNRALLTLLYRSGLRVSEVLALRPADVDLEQHTIRLLATKSGTPQTRGFHPSADDALGRWLDTRKALGIGNHGKRLFCTLAGGPLSDDYARGLLRRLGAKAGIDKRVHPHGLRHTFADELRRSGVDVVTISKLLGHSSVAVTARYLDHLTNGQAIETLSAARLPELDI